jgi:hypothetical protein
LHNDFFLVSQNHYSFLEMSKVVIIHLSSGYPTSKAISFQNNLFGEIFTTFSTQILKFWNNCLWVLNNLNNFFYIGVINYYKYLLRQSLMTIHQKTEKQTNEHFVRWNNLLNFSQTNKERICNKMFISKFWDQNSMKITMMSNQN